MNVALNIDLTAHEVECLLVELVKRENQRQRLMLRYHTADSNVQLFLSEDQALVLYKGLETYFKMREMVGGQNAPTSLMPQ